MARLQKIIVPTDFSETANRALAYALRFAETRKARLVVMTVIPDLPITDEEMLMLRVNLDDVKRVNAEKINAAKARLEKLVSPAVRKRVKVEFVVRDGKPYQEIIHAAEELDADLIVMANRSSHGLKDRLMGSTTDRVVENAPCSVLVVREKTASGEKA